MSAVLPPNPDVVGVARHLRARVLPILTYPNDTLHKMTEPVTEFDDELGQLLMDMYYTMESNQGIGLAAPQVDVLKRVITISIPHQYALESQGTEPTEYSNAFFKRTTLINPEIIEVGNDRYPFYAFDEGCLSVPGYFEKRKRSRVITVSYQSSRGYQCEETFQGLTAFAIQHEIDHLNGKLFIDDLSPLKKQRIRKKVEKTLKRTR